MPAITVLSHDAFARDEFVRRSSIEGFHPDELCPECDRRVRFQYGVRKTDSLHEAVAWDTRAFCCVAHRRSFYGE
jgi:hypothetical protein